MSCWLFISATLLALVAWVSPQQLPVIINKVLLVSLAAYVGYLISVSTFPYARPGHLLYLINHTDTNSDDSGGKPPNQWELMLGRLAGTSMICRAVIMGASMLAVALGL